MVEVMPAPTLPRLTTSLAVAALALAGCSFEGSVDDGAAAPPSASSAASPTTSPSVSGEPTATAPDGTGEQDAEDPPSDPTPDETETPEAPEETETPDGLQEIRFPPGQTSTTVRGEASSGQGDRYVFAAAAGQRAGITITSAGDQVGFSLVAPDGTPLKTTMGESSSGSWELPSDGDYVVGIASPQDGLPYTLTLSVR